MTRPVPRCRKHEWGYVELVSRKVEVYHASPVGGFCIRCGKLRHHNRYGSLHLPRKTP